MAWTNLHTWTIPEQLLAALLALWFAMSLLAQMTFPLVARLRAYDLLELLPAFRFFAPIPRLSDYQLDVRFNQNPWTTIPISYPRNFITTFWNPRKRTVTAFHHATGLLLQHVRHHGSLSAKQSLAYLQLLSLAEQSARTSGLIQFRIVFLHQHDPAAPSSELFRSDWHTLPQ